MDWSWELVGDVALRLQLQPVPDGGCNLTVSSEGPDARQGPVEAVIVERGGRMGTSLLVNGALLHAHADDTIDTRAYFPAEGYWRGQSKIRLADLSEGAQVTWVLRGPEDPRTSRHIDLELLCSGPMGEIRFFGGRSVDGFSQDSMEGGIGVTAVDASVARGGRVRLGMPDPDVNFLWSARGGTGTLRLLHPQGDEEWALDRGERPTLFRGTPGEYEYSLDWQSLDGVGIVWGLLYGLQPLPNLEALESLDANPA